MKKVLIATGGTGGHVIPSEALAVELKDAGVNVLMSGANLSQNKYLSKGIFPLIDIRSGRNFKGIVNIFKGVRDSMKVIDRFKPDVIVGFGSYASFPVLAAGLLKRVPLILWAADTIPGKVIRWFSPFSRVTAIQFPEAATTLFGKVELTRLPLRKNLVMGKISRDKALEFYSLDGKKPVILVMGGSHGAKFLNVMAPTAISELPNEVEVIHLAGSDEEVEKVEALYLKNGILARVKAFEPEMHKAWQAADVCCTRAGAVSCAEQMEFEVPGVLIPYPFSTDSHQEINGKYLVSIGLAEMGLEGDLTPEDLSDMLYKLLQTNKDRREKMKSHKNQMATKSLKQLVMENLQ